ncbi:MAG: hypothetical protein ACK5LY_00920 [Lachnospirales bacterium]
MKEFIYLFLIKIIIVISISTISITLLFKIKDFNYDNRFSKEKIIEEDIEKYLNRVYSIEGVYPNDVYYLENFGFTFDTTNYNYNYTFISQYIRPEIVITKKME